jgi:hypothetical protein
MSVNDFTTRPYTCRPQLFAGRPGHVSFHI